MSSSRRIELKVIREISGRRGVNGTETEAIVYEIRAEYPAELSECWCGMYIRECTNYKRVAQFCTL